MLLLQDNYSLAKEHASLLSSRKLPELNIHHKDLFVFYIEIHYLDIKYLNRAYKGIETFHHRLTTVLHCALGSSLNPKRNFLRL